MKRYVFLFVFVVFAGCDDEAPTLGCNADADCRESRRCDLAKNTCVRLDEKNPATQVDIVIIVDDSPGMCGFQHELRSSARSLVESLEGFDLDFSIAVTTTSIDKYSRVGQFQSIPETLTRDDGFCMYDVDVSLCPGVTGEHAYAWLLSEDPYYQRQGGLDIGKFQQHLECRLTVGSYGLGFETGLEASRGALSYPGQKSFLRDDSVLVFIYVSSSNDCSNARDLGFVNAYSCEWERDRLVPVDEYVEFFKHGLDPAPKAVLAFGIIAPDDGRRYEAGESLEPVCASALGEGESGYRYSELISALNGTSYSICDPPYDGALREIASVINRAARQ